MESYDVLPYTREEAKRLAHDISEKIAKHEIAKHEIDLKDAFAIVFSDAKTLAIKEMLYRIASGKQD